MWFVFTVEDEMKYEIVKFGNCHNQDVIGADLLSEPDFISYVIILD